MIFGEDSFFQFRVHLDPIFIKKSRFHTLQQEKLVTKVILLSLSWTVYFPSWSGNRIEFCNSMRSVFDTPNVNSQQHSSFRH